MKMGYLTSLRLCVLPVQGRDLTGSGYFVDRMSFFVRQFVFQCNFGSGVFFQ